MADYLTNVRLENSDGSLVAESVSVDLTDYDLPNLLMHDDRDLWPLMFFYEGRLFAMCDMVDPFARPIGIPTAERTPTLALPKCGPPADILAQMMEDNFEAFVQSTTRAASKPTLVDRGDGCATTESLRQVWAWASGLMPRFKPQRDGGELQKQFYLRIKHVEAGYRSDNNGPFSANVDTSGSTASARFLLDHLERYIA